MAFFGTILRLGKPVKRDYRPEAEQRIPLAYRNRLLAWRFDGEFSAAVELSLYVQTRRRGFATD